MPSFQATTLQVAHIIQRAIKASQPTGLGVLASGAIPSIDKIHEQVLEAMTSPNRHLYLDYVCGLMVKLEMQWIGRQKIEGGTGKILVDSSGLQPWMISGAANPAYQSWAAVYPDPMDLVLDVLTDPKL